MDLRNKNPRTKVLKLRNLIIGYSTQDLVRGKQNGFIPMIIMIVLVLAVFIWLVYSRVSQSH